MNIINKFFVKLSGRQSNGLDKLNKIGSRFFNCSENSRTPYSDKVFDPDDDIDEPWKGVNEEENEDNDDDDFNGGYGELIPPNPFKVVL